MTVSQRVTRIEIAEAVGVAFAGGGADRAQILAAAGAEGRPELVKLLESLPDRRYGRLNQLWEELEDVPVGV